MQSPFQIKVLVLVFQGPGVVTEIGVVLLVVPVSLVAAPLKGLGSGAGVGVSVPAYSVSHCGPIQCNSIV